MPQLIWTRISPKKEVAIRDFKYFEEEITSSGEGHWDGDKYNKATVGDTFAFVVGPIESASLEFYTIVRIGDSSERLKHWSTADHLKTRKVVILRPVTGNATKTYNFKQFVSQVYKSKNHASQFPNQTQRVMSPLPKDIILEEHKTKETLTRQLDEMAEFILKLKNKK
jgi:hypothetical protein